MLNRPKHPSHAILLIDLKSTKFIFDNYLFSSLVLVVPPSLLQPLLPLSLPVDMAVIPQSWRFLPLSQAELGLLFSNSSPFSFSQSLFIVPPHHHSPPASLQASFGPYSVAQVRGRKTREPADLLAVYIIPADAEAAELLSCLVFFLQVIPESGLPLSHLLSASLLSEHVERERDAKGQERFTVRVLFHKWGDTRFRRTCVTLHAFKETEEHRASCMTQVRTRGGCFPPLSHVHPSIHPSL